MKKSVVQEGHPYAPLEQIIAHALWQKSRKRQPSFSLPGWRNPRRLLVAARQVAALEFLKEIAGHLAYDGQYCGCNYDRIVMSNDEGSLWQRLHFIIMHALGPEIQFLREIRDEAKSKICDTRDGRIGSVGTHGSTLWTRITDHLGTTTPEDSVHEPLIKAIHRQNQRQNR